MIAENLNETQRFLRDLGQRDLLWEAELRRIQESYDLYANYVDSRELYDDEDGTKWQQVGVGMGGTNRPMHDFSGFATEQELTDAREACRRMLSYSEFVINGHNNRVNYVVGTGHIVKAVAKKGEAVSEETVEAVQEFLDDFCKVNKWHQRQRETMLRYDRDGEFFRRKFRDANGMTKIRFVEPWQVVTPNNGNADASFGVETDPDDGETVVRYHVAKLPNGSTEAVDAEEIQHVKANVTLNVKRGVPLFWPCRLNVKRCDRTLRNIAAKSEMAAAITLIRKHKAATSATASTFANSVATATRQNQVTGLTDRLRKYDGGTTLDVSANTDYEGLNLAEGIDEMVSGLAVNLRAIAAIAQMPEFMLTSDASNANFASTMVAEGPAVKSFSVLQAMLRCADEEILDDAIAHAVSVGRLPAEAMDAVEIQIDVPGLAVRDKAQEATANETYARMGLKSPQTIAGELDLDYDQEMANIEAHMEAGHKWGPQPVPDALGGEPSNDPAKFDAAARMAALRGQVDKAASVEEGLQVIQGFFEGMVK